MKKRGYPTGNVPPHKALFGHKVMPGLSVSDLPRAVEHTEKQIELHVTGEDYNVDVPKETALRDQPGQAFVSVCSLLKGKQWANHCQA
jgi:hypothetical protein